jgi:hypothetical protein
MKLQNEQDAIQQAVEAGYPEYVYCENFDMYESTGSHCESEVLLDPAFWQALGKARGWENSVCFFNSFVNRKECDECWKLHALGYFETKLSGADTSQFFKDLP